MIMQESDFSTLGVTSWNTFSVVRITELQDSVHRLEFLILENTTFRKLDLFLSSSEGNQTSTLLGPLERVSPNHWTMSRNPVILSVTCVRTIYIIFVTALLGCHYSLLLCIIFEMNLAFGTVKKIRM
jgi:hypothetical protein